MGLIFKNISKGLTFKEKPVKPFKSLKNILNPFEIF